VISEDAEKILLEIMQDGVRFVRGWIFDNMDFNTGADANERSALARPIRHTALIGFQH